MTIKRSAFNHGAGGKGAVTAGRAITAPRGSTACSDAKRMTAKSDTDRRARRDDDQAKRLQPQRWCEEDCDRGTGNHGAERFDRV
jgi:hypothetical protein